MLLLPSHYHERDCLAVVLEGSVDKAFAGSRCQLAASTAVTMPAGERHLDRFERGGAQMLVIEPEPGARKHEQPYGVLFDQVNQVRDSWVPPLAWRIQVELHHPDAVSALAIEGLVLELLAASARCRVSERDGSSPPRWLRVARDYLHDSVGEQLGVTDLAAVAGVHPAHLARSFRAHYGTPIGAYARRLRIDWSATQLARSDAPLRDIAHNAGFSDQSHFTRVFKRHTGLTPGQYRQATRRDA
jgi:AraC family transcriptional regulator